MEIEIPICPRCEEFLKDRAYFPHCENCHTKLYEHLAERCGTGYAEIANPRCTDAGNAIRFASMWHDDVVYVPKAGRWWVWSGSVWQEDTGNILMMRLAKLTVQRMFIRAASHKDDPELRDAELKWAKQTESVTRISAMLESAKSVCRTVCYEDFDKDLYLFNVANATIDLRTGKARDFSRRDLMTRISPVPHDPDAKAPRWEQFLREIQPGHDECCIPFIKRGVGYTMTGCVNEECFFVLYGASGRNGKGTFMETLKHIMGEYACAADFNTFVIKKGDEKLNDIAGFRGARLVVAAESESSKRLAEAKIKRMTGGDTLRAEFKYQEQFDLMPHFKIWLQSNYKPRVVGTDNGIWDRVHLIDFPTYFDEEHKDKHLKDRLRAEASGILNWCVEAAVEWHKEGLGSSPCIRQATENYRTEQNVLGNFIEDCCATGLNLWVTKEDLYKAYKLWAEQSGEYVMTKTEFGDRIGTQFEAGRSGSRGRHWKGVALRREYNLHDEDEQDELVKAAIQ